jgi:hypothetical protein
MRGGDCGFVLVETSFSMWRNVDGPIGPFMALSGFSPTRGPIGPFVAPLQKAQEIPFPRVPIRSKMPSSTNSVRSR